MELQIRSQQGVYGARFVDDMATLVQTLASYKNAVVIMDERVASLYSAFTTELQTLFPVFCIAATEENKTLIGAEKVLTFLQDNRANKQTTVIAVGGGIVQDIASFAAHIFYRGIPFVFVPTTLLAMCDSCIGAKCGLNFHGFKNQLGAFHAPHAVFICDVFLETLSAQEISSGYGEIFKLALIAGGRFWETFLSVFMTQGIHNSHRKSFVFDSLATKKTFIEEDELDVGVRRILNFGHTFGHALELATSYAIPHGIAVARGIDIIGFISYHQGLLSLEYYQKIHEIVLTHFCCGFQPSIHSHDVVEYVKKDKKITGDKINLVLLESAGKLKLQPMLLDAALITLLENYFQENTVLYTTMTEDVTE